MFVRCLRHLSYCLGCGVWGNVGGTKSKCCRNSLNVDVLLMWAVFDEDHLKKVDGCVFPHPKADWKLPYDCWRCSAISIMATPRGLRCVIKCHMALRSQRPQIFTHTKSKGWGALGIAKAKTTSSQKRLCKILEAICQHDTDFSTVPKQSSQTWNYGTSMSMPGRASIRESCKRH